MLEQIAQVTKKMIICLLCNHPCCSGQNLSVSIRSLLFSIKKYVKHPAWHKHFKKIILRAIFFKGSRTYQRTEHGGNGGRRKRHEIVNIWPRFSSDVITALETREQRGFLWWQENTQVTKEKCGEMDEGAGSKNSWTGSRFSYNQML